jgi:excinuclease ABC subunit C
MSEDAAKFDSKSFLKRLTHRPGVYRMLNAAGDVIYVGKALDLKRRVSSYFNRSLTEPKTLSLMRQVADVEVTVTNTEGEALILEYNLIKKHKPRFNVVLRDDKSYPYIYVSTRDDFPRIEFHRGPQKRPGKYFGPYPNTIAVRRTINELQKLFQIRQCSDSYFANRSRPCLQYQIRRCTAPCTGLIDRDDYAADIQAALAFLQGRNREVIGSLVERMDQASNRQEYEQAARFRDQVAQMRAVEAEQVISRGSAINLDAIGLATERGAFCVTVLFVRNGSVLGSRNHFPRIAGDANPQDVIRGFLTQYYLGRTVPDEIITKKEMEDRELLENVLSDKAGHKVMIRTRVRGDRSRWRSLAETNARQGLALHLASKATIRKQLADLATRLELDAPPERIECFDVSHTQGEATVASCVVFNAAGPVRSDYRRFNIATADAGDDYAAMREALRRRYARIKKGEVPLPDLLLIDGGKGQLAEAMKVLAEAELDVIQVVAIAKGRARKPGLEQLFLAGKEAATILPQDSSALLLLQQVRDEAHRFAIGGHRQQRDKARRRSPLESVHGLGPKRRKDLLNYFGGLQGVRSAGIDDLVKVPGISRNLAEKIYSELHVNE